MITTSFSFLPNKYAPSTDSKNTLRPSVLLLTSLSGFLSSSNCCSIVVFLLLSFFPSCCSRPPSSQTDIIISLKQKWQHHWTRQKKPEHVRETFFQVHCFRHGARPHEISLLLPLHPFLMRQTLDSFLLCFLLHQPLMDARNEAHLASSVIPGYSYCCKSSTKEIVDQSNFSCPDRSNKTTTRKTKSPFWNWSICLEELFCCSPPWKTNLFPASPNTERKEERQSIFSFFQNQATNKVRSHLQHVSISTIVSWHIPQLQQSGKLFHAVLVDLRNMWEPQQDRRLNLNLFPRELQTSKLRMRQTCNNCIPFFVVKTTTRKQKKERTTSWSSRARGNDLQDQSISPKQHLDLQHHQASAQPPKPIFLTPLQKQQRQKTKNAPIPSTSWTGQPCTESLALFRAPKSVSDRVPCAWCTWTCWAPATSFDEPKLRFPEWETLLPDPTRSAETWNAATNDNTMSHDAPDETFLETAIAPNT